MRGTYRDPVLVWGIVAAYMAHLAEEFFGGFPEWFAVVSGRPLPRDVFLVINGIALVVLSAAAHASTRREPLGWMAVALGTIVLFNGSAHLLATIATGTYSPGVVTGVLLYLPVGLLELSRARRQAPPSDFSRGVLAGLAAHAVVTITAVALT